MYQTVSLFELRFDNPLRFKSIKEIKEKRKLHAVLNT